VVGHARANDALEIAYLDGQLYVAEADVVSRVPLVAGGNAVPVAGLPGLPTALAADGDRGRLYVGTTNGSLRDGITVYEPGSGTIAQYDDGGFAGVTALGMGAGGDLLAADDPGAATGAMDSADQARLWRLPLQAILRPAARIGSAPAGVGRDRDVAFALSAPAAAGLECRLDGGEWTACGSDGTGAAAFQALADGVHRFEARAVDPVTGPGTAAVRVFVVDTRAPQISVQPASGNSLLAWSPVALDLVADEPAVALEYSVDGQPFGPCDPDLRLLGLAPGEHTFTVRATDAAGNVGEPVSWTFTLTTVAPVDLRPADPDPVPGAPGRAAAPAPAPAAPATAATAAAAAPRAAGPAPVSPRTMRISTPVRAGARSLTLTVRAPADARRARITLRKASGTRTLVARDSVLLPARANRIAMHLTRGEGRRLRPGLYLVTVTLDGGAAHEAIWLRVVRP
jgi:hypothetical protein